MERTDAQADAQAQGKRRRWATPRVIVSEVSGAQFNLLVITTDHTRFGGSSGGTQNS